MPPKQPVLLVNVFILVGVYGPVGISGSLHNLKKNVPYRHICFYSTFTECLLCARTTGDIEMNRTVSVAVGA